MKSLHSCLTLSLPGSSVHVILQERIYWSGLPCPSPRDFPDPGTELTSPVTIKSQVNSLPLSHRGSPLLCVCCSVMPNSLPLCVCVCVCVLLNHAQFFAPVCVCVCCSVMPNSLPLCVCVCVAQSCPILCPCVCVCVCMLLSHAQFFATPWTSAHHVPLAMGFSRQECWSALLFPSLPFVFS